MGKNKKKKLTQKEIEDRLEKQAQEVREIIKKLEESQKVTKETLDLEFTI